MATVKLKKYEQIINEIPEVRDFTSVYFYVNRYNIDQKYIQYLDELSTLKDEIISSWLNITTRTYRNYKTKDVSLKDNTKEHIVLLISLYKHGMEVFNTKDDFEKWLTTPNVLLDKKSPADFLDTVSGLKFIDNRLTAIEYGENV
ncbi:MULTISPECIES: antitoxin Xre/MbcA/ParS toxin-binding domain-containing protein [Empedobacter]|uniref:antitoxin Xre/MbcA/ParS toxin-binding domain-containing protein n=1 Tax=Empedobacter TaxID=59734 RepID=UPI001C8E540D|nr:MULTISPECIES: MbcA/ParS/Xre antitoxin family protein [Empedobacter]MBY0066197.1 MbcA/ParS/Xre antitoxin family protein [Empedobacter falsenii]